MVPDDGHGEDVPTRCASTPLDQQVAACIADISSLRRKQEQFIRKHEEAEGSRQGQLQSVSERVYELERRLKRSEEEQTDAIEKANIVFQKQYGEVLQDRQNLAHSIQQVNENFERLYRQLEDTRQGLAQAQGNLDLVYEEMRHQKSGVAVLQQSVATVEATMRTQQRDIDTIIACLADQNVYTHAMPTEIGREHLDVHDFMGAQREADRLAASVRHDRYAHRPFEAEEERAEHHSFSNRGNSGSARPDRRDYDEDPKPSTSFFDAMSNSSWNWDPMEHILGSSWSSGAKSQAQTRDETRRYSHPQHVRAMPGVADDGAADLGLSPRQACPTAMPCGHSSIPRPPPSAEQVASHW